MVGKEPMPAGKWVTAECVREKERAAALDTRVLRYLPFRHEISPSAYYLFVEASLAFQDRHIKDS
jgi:hypothetical protein